MTDKIAQEGMSMFERNIGHFASRGKELEFRLDTGEMYTGYVAGLDDFYIQVCLSEDQSLVMFPATGLIVQETGQTLFLHDKNGTMDPALLKRIHEKVDHFMKVASAKFTKKAAGLDQNVD